MVQSPRSRKQTLTSLRQGTTDPRAVESYYDDWASSYDTSLQAWQYRAPEDAAALLETHLAPGARVLDVGCGTGLFGLALRNRVEVTVDGLDISAGSLKQAASRKLYARLLRHNLQNLPLPVADGVYDAAASVGVLTYIADAEALLRDLCRAVRSGGAITFTQRTDLWEDRNFEEMIARLEAEGIWRCHHVSAPNPYLPGNTEFGDEIRVIHTLCSVI